jgi:hypothetical protein
MPHLQHVTLRRSTLCARPIPNLRREALGRMPLRVPETVLSLIGPGDIFTGFLHLSSAPAPANLSETSVKKESPNTISVMSAQQRQERDPAAYDRSS